ncbi:hypothetical protein [Paraburkholderia phenoliruptrix]|uniref:hypothetical protein n=1 Tax=Paraburkholderia phenoliruptrix TaxID=252970 RepID=UPI0034CE8F09
MARYLWNLLLILDQAVNTVLGPILNLVFRPEPAARFGDPGETLSSVFGKNVRAGKCVGCRIVCGVLNWIQPGHCADSIQTDEGARAD